MFTKQVLQNEEDVILKEVSRRKQEGRVGLIIIVVVFIFLAYWIRQGVEQGVLLEPEKGRIQAVFLDNGEVYFGKIFYKSQEEIVLRDIYYLQVLKSLQYSKEKEQGEDVSLIKLGKELHGPIDEMRINRGHIVYIEDLRDDSKVVQAIDEYEKN
jgi:hypothetical protein